MIKHECDFCKVGGFDTDTMNLMTLKMSKNYPEYNIVQGMFGGKVEFELCPVCYERITKDIKIMMKI